MSFFKNIVKKLFKKLTGLEIAFMKLLKHLIKSKNYRFLTFSFPGDYYSPIPNMNAINFYNNLLNQNQRKISGIDLNEDLQLKFLKKNFLSLYKELSFPDQKNDQFRYYFDNVYFTYGDLISLYCMLCIFNPKQIIEIGSGFSSAAMLDINDQKMKGNIDITFIEPYPERLFMLLKKQDKEKIRILREPVQKVATDTFKKLIKNDILFIDSSHVVKINSDVQHIIFNLLPLLNPGVIIHFHDIFWPFEYPRFWFEEGRAWNELYFLRAFLVNNKEYELLFFNSFIEHFYKNWLSINMPAMLKKPSSFKNIFSNTSLWIRKRSKA